MSRVIDAMFERKVEPGDHVIQQGDGGDNFYVIESGTYDVIKKCEVADTEGQRVLRLDDRGSFGELALMYNQPRAATVVALTAGTLWAMDRPSFRRIVLRSAYRKRQVTHTSRFYGSVSGRSMVGRIARMDQPFPIRPVLYIIWRNMHYLHIISHHILPSSLWHILWSLTVHLQLCASLHTIFPRLISRLRPYCRVQS
jgi:hypothetical protein